MDRNTAQNGKKRLVMLRLSNATVLAARGTRKPWEIGPKLLIGNGAGEGNRTLVFSLEGCCSTIELHPHLAMT